MQASEQKLVGEDPSRILESSVSATAFHSELQKSYGGTIQFTASIDRKPAPDLGVLLLVGASSMRARLRKCGELSKVQSEDQM